MADFSDFQQLDLRIGTILTAESFSKARVPAYKITIDFGSELGIKKSSAQITHRYQPEQLIGKQVTAIVNFPPRNIAGYSSEVLILGAVPGEGDVVLLQPDTAVQNGTKIS